MQPIVSLRWLKRTAIVAAVVCGAAVTWVVAAAGYHLLLNPLHCGGGGVKPTRGRVAEIARGVAFYQLDNPFRCPDRDELVGEEYVSRHALVDAWGTSITFHCKPSDADIVVRSAGPDKVFHTADDITRGAP